jgi:hypothetical protein
MDVIVPPAGARPLLVGGGDAERLGEHAVASADLDRSPAGDQLLQVLDELHGGIAVETVAVTEHGAFFGCGLCPECGRQDAQPAAGVEDVGG